MKNRLKYALALILAAATVLSFSGCFTITVELPSNNAYADNAGDEFVQTPDGIQADNTAPVDETQADIQVEQPSVPDAPVTEAPTAAPAVDTPAQAPSVTPEAPTAAPAASTPDKLSGQALLTYFNDAVNTVKTQKAGFKKSKLTTIKDLQLSNSAANTLVGFVKGKLLSETEDITEVKKGQSSVSVMSPSGKNYASALTMSDIKNIGVQKSGSGYVITVNLKDETNPTSNGHFSRCMDYMTVDDVEKVYAPKVGATVTRDNIKVTLTNSYAKLTVDANGKVTAYETLVNGVLTMKNASIKKVVTINTDLDITLSSTTKYTNFAF